MSNETIERIIVTVDDEHLSEIQAVATALQAAGMQVDNILPSSGIIMGEVVQSKLPDVKAVPGVKAVEADQKMQAI